MSETMFDLDEFVSDLDISPRKIKLAGATYTVRRDLSGPEIVKYWQHVRSQEDVEALGILVGDDAGSALNEALNVMPQKRMIAATQKLMQIAGLMGEDTSGE